MSIENKIKKLQAICDEKFGKLYDLSKSEIKGERDEFKAICLKHNKYSLIILKIFEFYLKYFILIYFNAKIQYFFDLSKIFLLKNLYFLH